MLLLLVLNRWCLEVAASVELLPPFRMLLLLVLNR
jgi:hypothetical protein